jgi:hypothetical protein
MSEATNNAETVNPINDPIPSAGDDCHVHDPLVEPSQPNPDSKGKSNAPAAIRTRGEKETISSEPGPSTAGSKLTDSSAKIAAKVTKAKPVTAEAQDKDEDPAEAETDQETSTRRPTRVAAKEAAKKARVVAIDEQSQPTQVKPAASSTSDSPARSSSDSHQTCSVSPSAEDNVLEGIGGDDPEMHYPEASQTVPKPSPIKKPTNTCESPRRWEGLTRRRFQVYSLSRCQE